MENVPSAEVVTGVPLRLILVHDWRSAGIPWRWVIPLMELPADAGLVEADVSFAPVKKASNKKIKKKDSLTVWGWVSFHTMNNGNRKPKMCSKWVWKIFR